VLPFVSIFIALAVRVGDVHGDGGQQDVKKHQGNDAEEIGSEHT
jgi:hypothetical protein